MNEKLVELDALLAAPVFFEFLQEIDIDDALDRRDEPEFDRIWSENFQRLERQSIPRQAVAFIDILREQAFKRVFAMAQSDELAARVSDDIELIAKDMALGRADSWPVSVLWTAYKRGIFPAQDAI